MTQISDRIRQAITILQKERDDLERQIHNLKSQDNKTKSSMHNLELRILSEGLTEDASNQASRIKYEVKELFKDRQSLHQDELTIKHLNQKLHEIQKKIADYEFWMKYADTEDEVKQEQARRKVFG